MGLDILKPMLPPISPSLLETDPLPLNCVPLGLVYTGQDTLLLDSPLLVSEELLLVHDPPHFDAMIKV